jgi:chloramphenicol-sensitive protein RarD
MGETSVMFLAAFIVLVFVAQPTGATFGSSPASALFLMGTGVVTVIPLLLFGAAAKRIPLSVLGFLQYIAPTLQLLVGVVVFKESITAVELTGFITVWVALAMFGLDRTKGRVTA